MMETCRYLSLGREGNEQEVQCKVCVADWQSPRCIVPVVPVPGRKQAKSLVGLGDWVTG